MRSNRLFSILAIAVAAAASAFVSVAVASRDYAVSAMCRAWDYVLDRIGPVLHVEAKAPSEEKPRVALMAAKAFMQRLVKRERPRVTPMWRMCPSI